MSKSGKVGVIVLFLFSIGAVISSLRVIGNIEEKRKEIGELTTSLEETSAELEKTSDELEETSTELDDAREEKTTLEGELKKEKESKEEIQKELNQKIEKIGELERKVEAEEEEKIAWKNKFEERARAMTELENKHKKAQQMVSNLQARLKGLPPGVEEQVVEAVPPVRIGGRVMVVARPFLSLELNQEVADDQKPTLSIYRKGSLIKELAVKKIRGAVLIAWVSPEESLKGIREDDQVSLGLSPGAPGIFSLPHMEGEVLDVISPGFLNIDLGQEGLKNIEPTLSVYRGGELFGKIELKGMDRLTVSVEVVEGTNIGRIKKRDIVKLIP